MRRLSPLALVVVLAACGGGTAGIDRAPALSLARAADAVAAAGDACTARDRALALRRRADAAVAAGSVPAAYAGPLGRRVDAIVSGLDARCLPAAQPTEPKPRPPGHGKPKPKPKEHEKPKPPKPPKHGHAKDKHTR